MILCLLGSDRLAGVLLGLQIQNDSQMERHQRLLADDLLRMRRPLELESHRMAWLGLLMQALP
jgi:hypothetical protein